MAAQRENTTIEFKISSATLTPDQISQQIGGLKPDNSWTAGTARGAFGAIEKQHGFLLESKLMPNHTIDMHLKDMLKRLAPYAVKIGALASQVTAEFTLSIARKRGPALHFERDDLRWIGAMNAKLDVDITIIAEAPPPKTGGAGAKPDETK